MIDVRKLAVFDEAATVTPEAFDAAVAFAARDTAMIGIGFIQGGKRVTPEDVYAPICTTCNSCGWLCDGDHEPRPWADQPSSGPNACGCGAGKPCPECNPLSKEKRDEPESNRLQTRKTRRQ